MTWHKLAKILKPRSCAQLAPGYFCIFGHVNGVLRICTRVQIVQTVQICSCLRGGANLLAPGANCAHERKLFNFYTF